MSENNTNKGNNSAKKMTKKKALIAGAATVMAATAIAVPTGILLSNNNDTNNIGYTISIWSDFEEFNNYDITVNSGTKIKDLKLLIVSSIPGYKITGFYKDIDCTILYEDEELVTADTKIYIDFEILTFKVRSFESISSTTPLEELEVEYKEKANLRIPTKSPDKLGRYEFVGWVDIRGNAVDIYHITSDIDVYANFRISEYNNYYIKYLPKQVTVNRGYGNNLETLTSSSILHYGDRIKITYDVTDGCTTTLFNIEGVTSVNGEDNWYIVDGDVYINYEEEYNIYIIGQIPNNVTVKRVQKVTGETVDEPINSGVNLTHGDILSITYVETEGYNKTTFAISGVYSVDSNNNLYGVNGDISIEYEEEIKSFIVSNLPSEVKVLKGTEEIVNGSKLYFGDEVEVSLRNELPVDVYKQSFDVLGATLNNETGLYKVVSEFVVNYTEEHLYLTFEEVINGYEVVGFNKGISKIDIPNYYNGKPVVSIGDNVFSSCTGLTSVTLPENLTTIGNNAFENCHGINSIVLPDKLTIIGSRAFNNCRGLSEIIIPNSVNTLGKSAFSSCYGLINIAMSNKIKVIEDSTFLNCYNLVSINLSNEVVSIGEDAFRGCKSLTSINISSKVTTIGADAFNGCDNLNNVTLESAYIYKSALGVGAYDSGMILKNAKSVKVLKTIVDNQSNNNEFLMSEKFSRSSEGEYYVFNLRNEYTVRFYNESNLLSTVTVYENDAAVYSGETPTKISTDSYDYEFAGWVDADGNTLDLTNVKSNINAYAKFNEIEKIYVINIVTNSSSRGSVDKSSIEVLGGSTISVNANILTIGSTNILATPNEANDIYKYSFSSWSVTSGKITSNMTITANFEATEHNWDEGEIVTPAGQSTSGTKKFTCVDCGHTKTEDIPSINDSIRPQIAEYASTLIGCKYVYGGTNKNGFDSSGLTMHIYQNFGIVLPHNDNAQASIGKVIDKYSIKPGDLVFFEVEGSTNLKVGIYYGNGYFISCHSSNDGVKLYEMSSFNIVRATRPLE